MTTIRPAAEADVPALRSIAVAAYQRYVPSKAAALGVVSWAKGPGVADVVLLQDGLM